METPTWEGAFNKSDHRTVGPHRAWCNACGEWCYPDDWCDCCHETAGHEKLWIGDDVRLVAPGVWAETERCGECEDGWLHPVRTDDEPAHPKGCRCDGDPCPSCGGRGWVPKHGTIEVVGPGGPYDLIVRLGHQGVGEAEETR